jgi:membrane protein implicated in regulation of membrane protease activity
VPWWGWIAAGALLLGAELLVVDVEFYLVFLGASAIAVGLVALAGADLPGWVEWLGFAALSLASTLWFRARAYRLLRPETPDLPDSLVGSTVVAEAAIAPGALGRVELRGSSWQARNTGAKPLAPGDRARVVAVDGLLLETESEA